MLHTLGPEHLPCVYAWTRLQVLNYRVTGRLTSNTSERAVVLFCGNISCSESLVFLPLKIGGGRGGLIKSCSKHAQIFRLDQIRFKEEYATVVVLRSDEKTAIYAGNQ